MPEDRPSREVVHNDKDFDIWLQTFEREMAKKTAKMRSVKNKPQQGKFLNG